MRRSRIISTLSLALAAAYGCSGGVDQGEQDVAKPSGFRDGLSPGVRDSDKSAVVNSTVDYGLALRTAAIKLTGNYPSLAEIKSLQDSPDPPTAFAALIDGYLARPTFATEQVAFWRDSLKLGGNKTLTLGGQAVPVNMEAAPTFAAMLVVQERPFTDLLTATSGTCPSYDPATGKFTAGDCPAPTAGVLTDPGVHSQFFSSLAFRRVRWVQETFACVKFPAESGGKEQHPGGTYYSPWPFNSISGGQSARVDFLDDKSLVCANCHSTINHMAPLFAKFDEAGRATADIAVRTPIPGAPFSVLTDWLPAGQTTAWRFNRPAADLRALGQRIAEDPEFGRCMATRVWNWALSRGDAVIDQATLTPELSTQLYEGLRDNKFNLKKLMRDVFVSASFVRF